MAAAEEKQSSSRPSSPACLLGYPDRFHAALKFHKMNCKGAKPLSNEAQLLLYALEQQAVVGPCVEAGSWKWNAVENAKQTAWKQLGAMNNVEAMRLFVRTVEEEQPDWYSLLQSEDALVGGAGAGDSAAASVPKGPATDYAVEGKWTVLNMGDKKKPAARYEHAGAIIKNCLYVIGGNYGGRYLHDNWKLNINTLEWSPVSMQRPPSPVAEVASPADASAATAPTTAATASPRAAAAAAAAAEAAAPAAPPPKATSLGGPPQATPHLAGHTVTAWKDSLIMLGGHSKPKDAQPSMPVHVFDTVSSVLASVNTEGEAPPPRGAHSATLIGRQVFVFGGEDPHRKALGDLWVLNVDTLVWERPPVEGKPPCPRSAHAAASYMGRYLVVFGGGSVATCFNDVHVLDTHASPMKWTQAAVAGVKVSPRAGHSGVVVGNAWYIIGGGNNVKGCTDLLALDLSNIGQGPLTWHKVASVAPRDPLSSEGICMVSLGANSTLLAFGGYNGKYHNTTSVFKASSSLCGQAQPGTPSKDASAASAAAATPAAPAGAASSLPVPAAVTEAKQDAAAAAAFAAKAKEASATAAAKASAESAAAAAAITDLKAQLDAAKKEAAEAKSAAEVSAKEAEELRKELASAKVAAAEAQKSATDAKAALSKESAKVMKLEVESAELKKQLSAVSEVQKEVESYRRAAKEAEEKKKGGGGIWGFMAPAPPAASK